MAEKTTRNPVKVSPKALDRARSLVAHIALNGWASLGIERRDPTTMAAVVEEGLRALEERAQGKRR